MPHTPAGSYRHVLQGLVACPDFRMLSPAARHLLLTLKLCPENHSALNVFMYYREVLVAHTGLSPEGVDAALAELETCPAREGRWLYRDAEVVWLAHPRLREPYAASESLERNPNQRKRLTRLVGDLPSESPTVQKFLRLSDFGKTLRKGLPPSSSSSKSNRDGDVRGSPQPPPDPEVIKANAVTAGVDPHDVQFVLACPEPYATGWSADWPWWISLQDGYPGVHLQREASKYMAHQASVSASRKHRNVKAGFRNWIATAHRWAERDADRKAARADRR